jgi:fluoroquinolone transport system permease protein
MGAFFALALKDARVVYRDGFLLTLTAMTLVLAVGMRLVVRFVPIGHIDLYLAPAAALLAPMMLGIVLGFGLIEEREQGTWLLLRVLPLSWTRWLLYLLGTSATLSFLLGLAAVWLYRRPAHAGFAIAMTAAGALTGPLMMLVLGAFSRNKIEGIAIQKLASTLSFVPVLVFVVPPPWQLLCGGWCPWYWLYLGLLRAYAEDPSTLSRILWPGVPDGLLVAAPFVLSMLATLALARRYRRAVV